MEKSFRFFNRMICAFIGPAKTRTSSIYNAAVELFPNNCYCGIKESYFHSLEESYKTYYKSILPKRTFLKSHHDEIQKMISSSSGPFFIVEPSYALAARSNLSCTEDILCILTVRDPVKRLISHYNMDLTLGVSENDINIELEDNCKYEQYVKNSKYYDLIQMWMDQKPGQLVIGDFEERKLYFTSSVKKHYEVLLKIRDILRKSTDIKSNEAYIFRYNFIKKILKNEIYKNCSEYIPRVLKQFFKIKKNYKHQIIKKDILRIIEYDYLKYKKAVKKNFDWMKF